VHEIEVFADVWCPFTHVGLRRFVAERDAGRTAGLLRVRAWPLELVNGRPLDPAFVAEEVEEIRDQVDAGAFAGFDPDAFPRTTLPALRLAATAYRTSPEVGEAVSLELRHRLFELGQDVGDPAVVEQVADRHGLPADDPSTVGAVEDDWAEGRRRGVVGSPHFFTPGGDFFCPALDVRKVEGHLRITADLEGFDRFLASCRPA
jgi:predicted DsbA family dithiol-disulfide isomerase